MHRFLTLNSASLKTSVNRQLLVEGKGSRKLSHNCFMIDDSPDTPKTEKRNGPAHYSGTILAEET
jgi:hypothetical protein